MGRAHEVRAAAMAKTAAARSKANAKYSKLIYMTAKEGGTDPNHNAALKQLIDKARKENVNSDVIKRAIDRTQSSDEGYIFSRYEAFGPNNSMFIIECLTDNTNRTYHEVRTVIGKSNYKMGQDGSVIHMFDNKAIFSFENADPDEVMMHLLEAGLDVDDVTEEDGLITVTGPVNAYGALRDSLLEFNSELEFLEDQIAWVPKMTVGFSNAEEREQFNRFKDQLDSLDDVQDLFHNLDPELDA